MAFDTSIFGLANKPTVPLQTPIDSAMKQLAIQQAQQNLQAGNVDMQAKQAAMASAPQMLELKRREAQLAFEKNMRESDAETRAKAHSEMSEFVRMATSVQKEAKTPQDFMAGVQALVPVADPDGSKGFAKFAQNLNPQTLKLMTDQTMEHKTWLEREFPKDVKVSGWHEGVDKATGKPAVFGLGAKGPVQYEGVAPAPKQSNMATIQLGDVSGSLKDPAEERLAQMVAEGRLAAPPMSRNNPRNLRIIARADELAKAKGGNDGLDATMFPTRAAAMKFFSTGKGADAFRQQETILHHAKVFEGIADALDNGNIQLANKLGAQFGAKFTGSDKPTNLKIAGTIFSSEVGKYLAGGQSTQAERAELSELLPVFNSPDQFKGGLKTLSNLVEGQRKSWQRQKEAALKGKPTEIEAEPPKSRPTATLANGSKVQLSEDGKRWEPIR